MFAKVLVANRGEIAVRVARALEELGVQAVAVYSELDLEAPHARGAREAYNLGAGPAAENYLNVEKILDVARRSGAEAIHPGYGFLAENAPFARECERAGIVFIGPPASAIEAMGSKTRARKAMENEGIPFVPGTSSGVDSVEQAGRVAAKIGYPVLLKAAAGGGGKGMRLVHTKEELGSALDTAQSEARRSFGDSEVYIEKALLNPRHIEMQVLADEHGNIVYLGERECSIQRRHQKVLEESPSPIVNAEMRRRMGEIAVRVAKTAAYTSAGTVEFLVDASRDFYFLEMNTRLQVEHPVTELTTGLDLVHLQIRIAAGEPSLFTQKDISLRGHAIECRIYAEDPDNNYFPSPGTISLLLDPAGPGIRLDSGVYEGWTVPIDYDPLLSKLIGYGTDRPQAISRLARALDEYFVGGIKTNLPLLRRILSQPDFQAGKVDTGYLDRLLKAETAEVKHDENVAAIAAGLFAILERPSTGANDGQGASTWKKVARLDALRETT